MARPPEMSIRALQPGDRSHWLILRQRLWPDSDAQDAEAWESRSDAATLVAERRGAGGLIGFLEVAARPYADGCETSPVAFVEGWYVDAPDRRNGVGNALVRAAMQWAKDRGIRELASDSLLNDAAAYHAHLGVGFEEVERSIKYRMGLG